MPHLDITKDKPGCYTYHFTSSFFINNPFLTLALNKV